jgi:hypothetical protein
VTEKTLSKTSGAAKRRRRRAKAGPRPVVVDSSDPQVVPDWTHKCDVCGATPVVPCTGLCGPCTFGEAATAGGNW